MLSKSWIEEVGDKRKISGKENIKKAQAALKEKREKENNKPLELESNDDDKTTVLTFKNKDKKRCKEIEIKMDLLIESQRQLHKDFQRRRKKKKKVAPLLHVEKRGKVEGKKGVEEKKSDNPCKSAFILF